MLIGVDLLDELCDTCFTNKNSYPGMTGQSIKFEQIQAVSKSGVATWTSSLYGTRTVYSVPLIWKENESSSGDCTTNRSKRLGYSTRSDHNVFWGPMEGLSVLQPRNLQGGCMEV